MDSLEFYEEIGAVAEILPADQRERFAALVLALAERIAPGPSVARESAVRRWARDAGHLKP